MGPEPHAGDEEPGPAGGRRRWAWVLGAASALLVVVGGLWLSRGTEEGPSALAGAPGGGGGGPPPAVVEVAPVRVEDVEVWVEAVGTVVAREQVTLTSEVPGRVDEVRFEEGQVVQQGEVLLTLDADEELAEVAASRARLEEARLAFERTERLRRADIHTEEQLESARAAAETARADLDVSRARRDDRVLRAPFTGRIGLRQVSPGERVAPGDPVATLDATGPLEVRFAVPAAYLPQLEVGQPVRVGAEVAAEDALPAVLTAIDPRADPETRAVWLEARLRDEDTPLRPGLRVRVAVAIETRADAALIPEEALILEGASRYVYRVSEGRAERVDVVLGTREPGWVEVREGLEAGDLVVVEGLQTLGPGRPVRVSERPAAPEGAERGSSAKRSESGRGVRP